jgi:VirE N-terminal domain
VNDLSEISFGLDISRPAMLETRNTAQILRGIASGEWRELVSRVRALPANSAAQKEAKIALPFCTFAGVFSYRKNTGLIRHSGQVGIDLDALGDTGAVAVIQAAVADVYCLAAFRSTRGEGVRLIFRIPPCPAENHAVAFEQVSLHVRRVYGHNPDESGKDVSRASFVSFDQGLWFNPSAGVLPINLPNATQRFRERESLCRTPYAGELALTCWSWYGRHYATTLPSQDGTVKTHQSLLDLGKKIALHAHQIKEPVTDRIIDVAFQAWLEAYRQQGLTLRCSPDEYRHELVVSVKGAERKPWFKSAAEKWLRWKKHKQFPRDGLPHEKILFAIRQHCAESKNHEFFIGVRDAGLLADTSKDTASRLLKQLCVAKRIEKIGERRQLRHAQSYRLLNDLLVPGPRQHPGPNQQHAIQQHSSEPCLREDGCG